MIHARIVSQGEELVTGQRTDTNATRIAGWLTERGIRVRGGITACDEMEDLVRAYQLASQGVELVISTGGLGPTTDDLTSEAVARAFNLPQVHSTEAMEGVEAAFARIRRPMAAINARQALLPSPSVVIPNPTGTAPGFLVESNGCVIICLPGVPSEMERMMGEWVLPHLERRFSLTPTLRRMFRVVGVGESVLQERINDLIRIWEPRGVRVGFRAMMPEVQVKLVVPSDVSDAESLFQTACSAFSERLGSDISGVDEQNLPATLGVLLRERGETVAVAESCTGGMLGEVITSIPGSSNWFGQGYITYSNAAKTALLGVSPSLLAEHGAVSSEVCEAMAEGARRHSGAAWAISITGIAGPDGGTPEKPVGTVYIGISGPDGSSSKRIHLGREREMNRRFSTWLALERLRRAILRSGEGKR